MSGLTAEYTERNEGGKIIFSVGLCVPLWLKKRHSKAGDGIRTHDVQLGKLAFYH